MISIDDVKKVIIEFSEKYNFIQQEDIEIIETSDFNENNYNLINGKLFVSYDTEFDNTIEFGSISITIGRHGESFEYYYSIDKNTNFVMRLSETTTKENLLSLMVKKCIHHNLICTNCNRYNSPNQELEF